VGDDTTRLARGGHEPIARRRTRFAKDFFAGRKSCGGLFWRASRFEGISMNKVLATVFGGVLGVAAVTAFAAAKRTPWGDPDLQGTYTTDNSIGVPLQRAEQFGARATLTDEEYDARVSANDVQVAKDKNPLPESEFAEDSAANNAPRH